MEYNKEELKRRIELGKIGEEINVEDMGFVLKYVRFNFANNYGYYWIAQHSYKNSGSVWTSFPMAGSNKVKHFKTLKGAKRNFIKNWC